MSVDGYFASDKDKTESDKTLTQGISPSEATLKVNSKNKVYN
jgi:hypothetical protein